LEWLKSKTKEYCEQCAYKNSEVCDICVFSKIEVALDLINRLQAENDNLKNDELPRCKDALRRANEIGMELQAENERLKENLNIDLENFATEYDNKIKVEAYKEFAERVKIETGYLFSADSIEVEVDNLLKELVGEDK
jgi:FtsZ-binding cell division protein ZapB